jgi:hypothetical protein
MRPPDIDADFARSNGMNVAAARQVAVSPKTYAVPGRGVVCVLESGGGGGCTPNEYVGLDFQVQTCGSLPRGTVAVSGLVTDDVVAVAIRLRSGKTVPVASVNNFMVARLTVRGNSEAPVAVQLKSDGGTSSIPVVSPRVDDLDCAAR